MMKIHPAGFATWLLLAVGAGFFVSLQLEKIHPAWSWLHAFCEAALVGAIADWFAVVALFRHPLGIPLPHTAIIPHQQRQMGASLGKFVVENFLTRAVVEPWLLKIQLSRAATRFLRTHALEVASACTGALPKILDSFDQTNISSIVLSQTRALLQGIQLAPALGEILDIVTRDQMHEAALNHALRLVDELISNNRLLIQNEIAKELPLPDLPLLRPIREMIAGYAAERTVTRMHSALTLASSDPQHPLRRQFYAWIRSEIEKLKTSPLYLEKGESIKQSLLNDPSLQLYADSLWKTLRSRLVADATASNSKLKSGLSSFLEGVASALEQEPDLQGRLDAEIRKLIVDLAETYGDSVSRLIATTVGEWRSEHLVSKLEAAVGDDLQFIRINGTLVGGTIGILLHAAEKFFGR
jgi:uncharacterized membrane-anchored protein YjiN (DUF445 family)